jgi:hypothetical protein
VVRGNATQRMITSSGVSFWVVGEVVESLWCEVHLT